MTKPTLDDLQSMVDDPTWDRTLLVKYLAEMNRDWTAKRQKLSEDFSSSNGGVPSTLNEISSDIAGVVVGPDRAWSALKLVYGIGKLCYECLKAKALVERSKELSASRKDFTDFAAKHAPVCNFS